MPPSCFALAALRATACAAAMLMASFVAPSAAYNAASFESPMEACSGTSWLVGPDLRAWKFADVRSCLAGYKMSLHDMVLTLENLYFGESDIYAFSEIAKDARASKEQNKCDLAIHDVQVDLRAEIEKVYEDTVLPAATSLGVSKAGGAAHLARLLNDGTEVGAFEFHCRLRDIFAPLNDGHTMYIFQSYVWFVLPVTVGIEKDSLGNLVLTVAHAVETAFTLELAGESSPSRLLSSSTPRRVLKINGDDPIAFVQRLADASGVYGDAGSRLNSLLLPAARFGITDGLWWLIGFDMGFPGTDAGEVAFTFEDGVEEVVDSVALANERLMEAALKAKSEDYIDFTRMEMQRRLIEEQRRQECETMFTDCPLHTGPEAPEVASAGAAEGLMLPAGAPKQVFAASRAYERLLPHVAPDVLHEAARLTAQEALDAEAQRPPRQRSRSGVGAREPHGLRSDLMDKLLGPTLGRRRKPAAHKAFDAPGDCIDEAGEEFPEAAHHVYTGYSGTDEMVTVTRLEGGVAVGEPTMVIKLTSMGERLPDFDAVVAAFQTAVIDAKNHKVSRVIFDIISNGGGLVALSDMLQSLVLKDFDPATLCNLYDKYLSEYWRQWVLSFGHGLEAAVEMHIHRLEGLAAQHPIEVLHWYGRWKLKDLSAIARTSNDVLGRAYSCFSMYASFGDCPRVMVDLQYLEEVQEQVESATSKDEILSAMRQFLRGKKFIPRVLFGESHDGPWEGSVGNVSGWFPFLGNEILDLSTQAPFEPPMAGILDVQSQEWGGTTSNYSRRGIFQTCPSFNGGMKTMEALKEQGWLDYGIDIALVRAHPFKDIAIVTDGLAGSAASAFPSRLMMSGKVTLFSYGGLDEPMDTSSFAGGNVLEYGSWWPRVAFAAELGMWLLPDTPWERLSRSLHHSGPHSPGDSTGSPVYPRPMPTSALARFNFNIMYLKELSSDDDGRSMLPRQFYRMPAHKHYDRWPRGLQDSCTNTTALLDLYRTIQKEDWCQVRVHPQYEGAGWGKACIPEATSCECCDIHQNPLDAGRDECETNLTSTPCFTAPCDQDAGPVACDERTHLCMCQEGTCARDGMCVHLEDEGLCPEKWAREMCWDSSDSCPENSVCVDEAGYKMCKCASGYCAVEGVCVEASSIAGPPGGLLKEQLAEEVVPVPRLFALLSAGAMLVMIVPGLARRLAARSRVAVGRTPLLAQQP